MEPTEFDAALGGTEKLPYTANSLKFAASRSVEIAAMTESIYNPSKTKLVFQSLPVHMRRRVMSHNTKRLPQKLRQAHLEQLKKSGLPPKQKRPSRKYRRRPANLLEEYNRRQKNNIWLETHIWHAKRFHMTNKWGYRLAQSPCDKAFRACYRASSAHCLIQDISYHTPIQITGPIEVIKDFFSNITDSACGLSITAKAYVTGRRYGEIQLYQYKSFPFGYIGKIQFLWEPIEEANTNKTLWLFVHPSFYKQLESIFSNLLMPEHIGDSVINIKKQKISNKYNEKLKIKYLHGSFNIFRLTGPNSHAVLCKSLKCIDDIEKYKSNLWVSEYKNDLYLKDKKDYWDSLQVLSSPSQLPINLLLGLVVKDPRYMRPTRRTKAKPENNVQINKEIMIKIPPTASKTPLWSMDIIKAVKSKAMTNGQFIEHVTKLGLIPGEIYEDDPQVQCVPVMLKQRPGSQDARYKKVGYGSGWDIIVPAGYGLPFWLTFIMFGARSGGLRETESVAFEMGECYMPPDCEAGQENEKCIENDLKERYFRLPPSKRVNYIKLAINSPFICPWKTLLKDWTDKTVDNFYVLRDWRLLETLQECIKTKKCVPQIEHSHACLVAVYVNLDKGNLKRNALICLPNKSDISTVKTLFEPHHTDPNEKIRKKTKMEHIKTLKRLRRHRIKLKKKSKKESAETITNKKAPSEYVKRMRELWLPSEVVSVRKSATRETMGYVAQGAFSFTEAKSCGIGYVAYNALDTLLKLGHNKVLIRNTCSRKYRLAKLQIVNG